MKKAQIIPVLMYAIIPHEYDKQLSIDQEMVCTVYVMSHSTAIIKCLNYKKKLIFLCKGKHVVI